MGRVIIVGDVHGCYYEMLDLMDKCARTSSDRVIWAGDLVDRGPMPRECVELAMKDEAVSGNHEEKQLQHFDRWMLRGSPMDPDLIKNVCKFRSGEHERTFLSLSPRHFVWMQQLPLYLELLEHNAVVVHAGVVPQVPLESQDPYILRHVQSIMPPKGGYHDDFGRMQHGYWKAKVETWWISKAPEGASFWVDFYDGSLGRVIYGHTGFDDPYLTEHTAGIDTGCCFGGKLTALILPDWKTVSVPARKKYYGGGPSDGRTVRRKEIKPGVFCYS